MTMVIIMIRIVLSFDLPRSAVVGVVMQMRIPLVLVPLLVGELLTRGTVWYVPVLPISSIIVPSLRLVMVPMVGKSDMMWMWQCLAFVLLH